VRGRKIDLTPTEYELLVALCQNPGEHMDATRLLEQVWHYPPGDGDPALVRNHVRNLRRKLEHDPDRPRIVTSAHGRGYAVSIGIERR
jgi:DNA-binding response OmpR family regulator